MTKFSFIVSFICVLGGFWNPTQAQLKVLSDQASGGAPVRANPYAEIKGSAYLMEFEMGSIIFSEKDTAENLLIAFNAYDNTLEHRSDGKLIAYLPSKISGFILNPDTSPRYFRSGYEIPKMGSNIFVEILVDGDYTLISHQYKVLGDDMSATYGSQKAKMFQNVEEFYVVKDGTTKLLKSKTKFLEETFGASASQALGLIKDYSLDLKEKRDVMRLVMMLNRT